MSEVVTSTVAVDMPLRTEADIIEAQARIINGFLNGSIEATKANAVARLLQGQRYLVADLPIKKLTLLAKLQSKNIKVSPKLLKAAFGEETDQ